MNKVQESQIIQEFLDFIMINDEKYNVSHQYTKIDYFSTGYFNWDFLELITIIEQEFQFFKTAEKILSNDAQNELLELYGLEKKDDYNKRIEKLTNSVKMKIQSGNFIQKYPEIEILFSIVVGIYLKHFNKEGRRFEKKQQEETVRDILRTLVQFYENLKQRVDVKDETSVIARKLIIFISMLDDLTFCYDLGDTLSEREYGECEHIVNERIIRAVMLDEIYRKKKKQQANKKKLRNICREIIADLRRAKYLQWVLDYNKVEPILDTLTGKIRMYIEEEVDLPYEKIIKETKESFPNVYLRGEEREEEKKRGFLEKIEKLEEYLKKHNKVKHE
ncbi:MAG: hypothetical protein KAU62_02180 [Candidatus Heimdallarchaeota archaeon]|nr:hypothetical protein [Candidatus Heimdallarchaeota archaeon]MCG3254867.1 hypothetical protein [Candidatus Heimdallarchaeota archaeon]MCK4609942.1 hypothetical protein [Candidatus Heimdallarchaeota archaeon]